ncbi:MAG: Tellurite resistance protein TerB, partial [Mesorhizobium sp.]
EALPERLLDTAYAAAFEVAAVDLEMRLEEVRVLQLIRRQLDLDTLTVAAIARAAKARLRTLN